MLLDVRTLKDIKEINAIFKECQTKALLEDKVVLEYLDVLTTDSRIVKITGGSLPFKPSKSQIIESLLEDENIHVYFPKHRATSTVEADIISKYLEAFKYLKKHVKNYTIGKALKNESVLGVAKKLSAYEPDGAEIADRVNKALEKELKERAKIKSTVKEEMTNTDCDKECKDFVDMFASQMCIAELLKESTIKPVGAFNVATTESKAFADAHLQTCQELNIPTVSVKSNGLLSVFTFYRDGVVFDLPIPTTQLKTLKHDLEHILDPEVSFGFYHTNVNYHGDKAVHIGLTELGNRPLVLHVRDLGDTKGARFVLHSKSKLLEQFRTLLNECIKQNEKLGRC